MFLFQTYAEKKREEDDPDHSPMGVRNRRAKKFLDETQGESLSVLADLAGPQLEHAHKVFAKHKLEDFISSLSPGAQNAIYASSFAWGYENSAKYVKNTMKLEEVKNAHDGAEKSRAVVASIKNQAENEGHHEKITDVSKFAWSYYNEDLKEVQATAGKSETMTDKDSLANRQQMQVPVSAPQAVAMGIEYGSHNPSLLYATATEHAIQQQQSEAKKEELARMAGGQKTGEPRIIEVQRISIHEKEAALALERKAEVEAEYLRTQKSLEAAIRKLDSLKSDDSAKIEKIVSSLPAEIYGILLARGLLTKRKTLKKSLVAWVAFCKGGKKQLSAISPSKLLKIASLTSLLRQMKG